MELNAQPMNFPDLLADTSRRPLLMGIVNVTPDSFSDGGKYFSPADAVEQGERLLAEGADLLDLGAESTRPGAPPVTLEEEWRRLQPALIALRKSHPDLPISIDTGKAEVARRALEEGATLINDVTGGADPAMFPAVARADCPYVLMHLRGTPATMHRMTGYPGGVVQTVIAELRQSLVAAVKAGVRRERLIADPGIGFSKDAAQSAQLLRALPEFIAQFGAVLLGASRKSFIGALDAPFNPAAADRLPGSLTAALHGAASGAAMLRVHDIAATRQALAVWRAIRGR